MNLIPRKFKWVDEWSRIQKQQPLEISTELKPVAEYLKAGLKAMCSLPKVNFKLKDKDDGH